MKVSHSPLVVSEMLDRRQRVADRLVLRLPVPRIGPRQHALARGGTAASAAATAALTPRCGRDAPCTRAGRRRRRRRLLLRNVRRPQATIASEASPNRRLHVSVLNISCAWGPTPTRGRASTRRLARPGGRRRLLSLWGPTPTRAAALSALRSGLARPGGRRRLLSLWGPTPTRGRASTRDSLSPAAAGAYCHRGPLPHARREGAARRPGPCCPVASPRSAARAEPSAVARSTRWGWGPRPGRQTCLGPDPRVIRES